MGLQKQDLKLNECFCCIERQGCTKKKGFLDVRMLYSACFGWRLICHTLMGKLLPWERDGQSSPELLFEAREPSAAQLVVICGSRVRERLGATGQHSRGPRVFPHSVTCICFDIRRTKVEQLVMQKCLFLSLSLGFRRLFLTLFLSDTFERGCRLMMAITHLWPRANTRMAVKHVRSRGREACMSCLPLKSQNSRKECSFTTETKLNTFTDCDTFFPSTFLNFIWRHYVTLNLMLLPWHRTFQIGHESQG